MEHKNKIDIKLLLLLYYSIQATNKCFNKIQSGPETCQGRKTKEIKRTSLPNITVRLCDHLTFSQKTNEPSIEVWQELQWLLF